MSTPLGQADEALRQIQAQPSYAAQILLTTAAVLRIQPSRPLHPRVLDIALGFGADAIVGNLPMPVAMDAMDKARAALPPVGDTVTNGEYALRLVSIAKTV
ncbi:hypothetical protein ACFVTT_34085 [Streptomyces niveus]|uniref:hypothetical protein n=1 Tax=Streptomyces niveus TaxID=193462 RepID=UPI00343D90E2